MGTDNKAVTCYLPGDIEQCLEAYCFKFDITRKDKNGAIKPALGTAIIEILKERFNLDASNLPGNVLVKEEMMKAIADLESKLAGKIESLELKVKSLENNNDTSSSIENNLEGSCEHKTLQTDYRDDEEALKEIKSENQETIDGLAQSELAKRLGVNPSTVGRWRSNGKLHEKGWEYRKEDKRYYLTR